ncbi:hypothetical protein, partial [Vibrio parahaemolyticus]|uniref:hypothetical protein n=1 Tax=Vibrio parahaemolyticus TaxID=670 RepID=UPI001E33FC26
RLRYCVAHPLTGRYVLGEKMQLDEYIKETLVQIAKGVKDATEEVERLGGKVNPPRTHTEYQSDGFGVVGSTDSNVRPEKQSIKFDIALQVKETSGVDASAKAKLAVLSIGGGVKNLDESHTAHRVQFEIPVDLPTKLS